MKAVQALSVPVRNIARAIESRDASYLKRLKGIGNRTAQKILATLEGKVAKFALIRRAEEPTAASMSEDFVDQVHEWFLFGNLSKYLVDVIAVLLVICTITGWILTPQMLRRRIRAKQAVKEEKEYELVGVGD